MAAANATSEPAAPEIDRRTRRKAETRRRLLESASELFIAHGYDGTRPQDIARSADVAAGTFYLHFSDKADVFRAFTGHVAEELEACMSAGTEGSQGFDAGLRGALEALLAYSDARPGVLRTAFADAAVQPGGESLRDRLAAGLAGVLRRGMAAGAIRSDYDPDLAAHGLVGLIHQILVHAAGRERRGVLDQVMLFCHRALVAPGGLSEEPR